MKIKIERRYLLVLAVLVLSAAVFSVIQWTGASPLAPNPGHSWSEIEKPADCPSGQYVRGVGPSLVCGTPGVAFGDLKRYVFNVLPAAFLSIIQSVFASPAAPNPGHSWDQIGDFPANCPAGQYAYGLGSSLLCSTPAGASVLNKIRLLPTEGGIVAPITWYAPAFYPTWGPVTSFIIPSNAQQWACNIGSARYMVNPGVSLRILCDGAPVPMDLLGSNPVYYYWTSIQTGTGVSKSCVLQGRDDSEFVGTMADIAGACYYTTPFTDQPGDIGAIGELKTVTQFPVCYTSASCTTGGPVQLQQFAGFIEYDPNGILTWEVGSTINCYQLAGVNCFNNPLSSSYNFKCAAGWQFKTDSFSETGVFTGPFTCDAPFAGGSCTIGYCVKP